MYVEHTGRIFVETWSPVYNSIKPFLLSCCEPVCRTQLVNEYAMIPSSLAAAASEGRFTEDDIREVLTRCAQRGPVDKIGKFKIPEAIEAMLQQSASAHRIRVVLEPSHQVSGGRRLAYHLVSENRLLLENAINISNVVLSSIVPVGVAGRQKLVFSDSERVDLRLKNSMQVADVDAAGESRLEGTRLVFKAEVAPASMRKVRREIHEQLRLQINCSYDAVHDTVTPTVKSLTLKDSTKLRPYQSASLERFFCNGVLRSGIIVLPCGAGKTLTGIAAASLAGKRCCILCVNLQSVLQWIDEFTRWSNIHPDQISVCTASEKQMPKDIFITTYPMLTTETRELKVAEQQHSTAEVSDNDRLKLNIFLSLSTEPFGLLILDEVHQAPADCFQRVIDKVQAHCVLGLTATLLREDTRIEDLRYLIGPKLYEANWLELACAGHLATVQCAEVRCPMPTMFLSAYLNTEGNDSLRRDIESMNPFKFWCTQALLNFHEKRGDKTIVFCDSLAAVQHYATRLGIPAMDGSTPNEERINLIKHFRENPKVNSLLISRVGDIALDLPEANVIVQISAMGASRRQEAQRLGRILRPKPPTLDVAASFFYTLVSLDTDEERNAFPRQQWLRDQGFSYRVLQGDDVLLFYKSRLHVPRLMCVGAPVWSYHAAEKWVQMEVEASRTVERAFLRGSKSVLLPQSSGRIVFDSVDAPHTFGQLEAVGPNGMPVRVRVRRGAARQHECGVLCFGVALSTLIQRRAAASEELEGAPPFKRARKA